MKSLFFFLTMLNYYLCQKESIDTLKITGKETEAMRLFKINARGLLPQIFQKTNNNQLNGNINNDDIELTIKNENKIIKFKKGHHYQKTMLP